MQHDLQHDRGFEQPWDRRPELGQRVSKWMLGHIGHGVGPVFLKTALCFSARESVRGYVLPRLRGRVQWRGFDLCHNSLSGSPSPLRRLVAIPDGKPRKFAPASAERRCSMLKGSGETSESLGRQL